MKTFLQGAYKESTAPVVNEFDEEIKPDFGQVPTSIRGILFRNGAGRLQIGNDTYDHPFDGDGMISRFEFFNGEVKYANKYVKTKEFAEEEAAQKMLYRAFGTNKPGGFFKNFFNTKFKNASNTNVIHHGGKLLSLWEGGWPHEIDFNSLNTLSRFSYQGRLKNPFGFMDKKINPQLPFSAHPKVDPKTGRLYNFGTAFGVKNRIIVYSVNPEGQLDSLRSIELDHLSFIHDFVITSESKMIFFCTPVSFDRTSMITGQLSPANGIKGDPSVPTKIIVLDLNGEEGELSSDQYQSFEAPYSFIFHHVNAFEDERGIQVYSVENPDFPTAEDIRKTLEDYESFYPATRLVKYTLRSGQTRADWQELPMSCIVVPRVSTIDVGSMHEFFYATAAPHSDQFPFMNELKKIRREGGLDSVFTYEKGLVGEPILADGDRYILSLCYNGYTNKSELLILDAL
ncbi:MAG: carotenoid oxygenase family protein, partial [Bdellovibrionales bacterium]|nr:carotenoid oxygenase family protein [Bdellovibrionales bacterium]